MFFLLFFDILKRKRGIGEKAMEVIAFISVVYVCLVISINLLFPSKLTSQFTGYYLILFVLNLLLSNFIFYFMVLIYVSQVFFMFLKVNNWYLGTLLTNFLLTFVGLIIFLVFDVPRYLGSENLYASCITGVFLMLILIVSLKLLDLKYRIFDYFSGYTRKMKWITILSVVVMVALYIVHAQYSFYTLDYILTSLIILLFNFFSTVIFILYILYQKKNSYLESFLKDKQETKEYYKKLDQFRHDYLNFITALEYGVKHQSFEEAEALIQHFKQYSLDQIDDARHNPLKKIQDSVIKGLLYDFTEKADRARIPYTIQVLTPISEVNIDYIDLIRLLSIALTNALEHYQITAKQVPITILLDQQTDKFFFKITNPADLAGESSLRNIMKRGYSVKKNGGLGLYNFSKITEQYTNVTYQLGYKKQVKIFTLELTITA